MTNNSHLGHYPPFYLFFKTESILIMWRTKTSVQVLFITECLAHESIIPRSTQFILATFDKVDQMQ